MTRHILLETVMLPVSVIQQPDFWIEKKNGAHLHVSNVYLWYHSTVFKLSYIAIVYTTGRFESSNAAMVG